MKNSKSPYFIVLAILFLAISSCSSEYLEIGQDKIASIYNNSLGSTSDTLGEKNVLYIDYSNCVVGAVDSSEVWKAVFPNFTQYQNGVVLIKGDKLEEIKSSEAEASLKRLKGGESFSNIEKALNKIVNGKNQAVLITDFEAFDSIEGNLSERSRDETPYLLRYFHTWLQKGYSIYIITEPYKDSDGFAKKRFYSIFTDDKLPAPIIEGLENDIQHLTTNGTCQIFKMTNSDITVTSPERNMCADDLDFSIEYGKGFDFVTIENNWEDIREYVMKLDEYGEPLPEEDKQPLLKNFKLKQGESYKVENIKVIATNITLDFVNKKKKILGKDISKAFVVDEKALKNNIISIYLTDKIFTNDFLCSGKGGNLIRLDFVIEKAIVSDYDETIFQWSSLRRENSKAICVSKSIRNVLEDINVRPTNSMRKLIHTVYIKTSDY